MAKTNTKLSIVMRMESMEEVLTSYRLYSGFKESRGMSGRTLPSGQVLNLVGPVSTLCQNIALPHCSHKLLEI